MSPNGPPKPLRLCVLSHPRTASNLFCKLFSEHPSIHQHPNAFLFAYLFGPDAQVQMKNEKMDELNAGHRPMFLEATYQAELDKLESRIAEAEAAGKIPMLKDHCCFIIRAAEIQKIITRPRDIPPEPSMEDRMLDLPVEKRRELQNTPYIDSTAAIPNTTVLPDRLLRTFAPVFIIRHPAKQIESWYKASRIFGVQLNDPDFELVANFAASRKLFEYYVELYKNSIVNEAANDKWPIVIDGDDVINDTEGMANRFCEVIGVDPAGVIYKWEAKALSKGPTEEAFAGTLVKSDGIKKNLYPKVPSITESSKKWKEEWGEEVANRLVQYAEEAMENYNYLHQFRLRTHSA